MPPMEAGTTTGKICCLLYVALYCIGGTATMNPVQMVRQPAAVAWIEARRCKELRKEALLTFYVAEWTYFGEVTERRGQLQAVTACFGSCVVNLARGLRNLCRKRYLDWGGVRHMAKKDLEPLSASAARMSLLEGGRAEEGTQLARRKLARGRESARRNMQVAAALDLRAKPVDSIAATFTGGEDRRLEAMKEAQCRGRVKGRDDLFSCQGCKGENFLKGLVVKVQLLVVPPSGLIAPVSPPPPPSPAMGRQGNWSEADRISHHGLPVIAAGSYSELLE